MHYQRPFLLTHPTGNNAFGWESRKDKTLFVPSLVEGTLADVRTDESRCVFCAEENGTIIEKHGLAHFVSMEWNGVKTVVMDNHNHAFYFWASAKKSGLFSGAEVLIHLDEHSDMRVPDTFLEAEQLSDLDAVFAYTNEVLNVGNYIVPSLKGGLFASVENIGGSYALAEWETKDPPVNFVLNIDLDFWSPHLDFIPKQQKNALVRRLAKKAQFITIATSPFFIEQKRAIEVLAELFR